MKLRFTRRTRVPGTMNKMEQKYYDEIIAPRMIAGEYIWSAYETIKLKLADKTFYTPDFAVLTKEGELEFHEVKGFWEDDARIKWKVAAQEFFWAKFLAITVEKKQWVVEEYGK
jgi:hypothetical protein